MKEGRLGLGRSSLFGTMALYVTPISESARLPVAALLLLALFSLLFWSVVAALALLLLMLLVIFLYREPTRTIPSSPLGVLSPVDGEVLSVETVTESQLERQAIAVTIKMQRLGPYVVRSPIEGKIMRQSYNASARTYSQWIQTDEQDDVLLNMMATPFSGALHYRVSAGERIGQGAHCTVLRFGREVQLYLPVTSQLAVKKGDRVLAGEDILATLVH